MHFICYTSSLLDVCYYIALTFKFHIIPDSLVLSSPFERKTISGWNEVSRSLIEPTSNSKLRFATMVRYHLAISTYMYVYVYI